MLQVLQLPTASFSYNAEAQVDPELMCAICLDPFTNLVTHPYVFMDKNANVTQVECFAHFLLILVPME